MNQQDDENISIRKIIARSLMAPVKMRTKKISEGNVDFAHYTRAETAFNIIQSSSFWLRNSRLMNDYSEMILGLRTVELNFAESSKVGGSFWQKTREIDLHFKDKVQARFAQQKEHVFSKTYIGCLSEYSNIHTGPELGKLSMWRAYGYPNGVALVFDGASVISDNTTLDVTSYPVFYPSYGVDLPALAAGIENLTQNFKLLKDFDPQLIANALADIMIHLAIGIKDSNFHEEAEWRVVFREGVYQHQVSSIKPAVVSGVPQLVCSVPLDDDRQLSLKRILKKIVIGPTEYPEIAREAFVKLLEEQGFDSPALKVFISNIPYRG